MINLDLEAPQLQRNAVSWREMFFIAPGTCVHVQESPKNGLIFKRLASVLATRRPMLSGKDQLGLLGLLCSLYFPPGNCCILSVRTRKTAGWERHSWMPLVYTSLLSGSGSGPALFSWCQAQVTCFRGFLFLSGSEFPPRPASGARSSD